MRTFSDQRVAALSWACVIAALGLSLIVPGHGAETLVAAAGLALVIWRFPPGRAGGPMRPGDLLWTDQGLGPAWTADRLRPGLVRDLEYLQGLALPPTEPLPPLLQATEVALRTMHCGGTIDADSLSDRDVIALALLRDAIVAQPPRAARLAAAFHDPAAVLDLRDRVRGGAGLDAQARRVA